MMESPWPNGEKCVVCLTVDFDGPSVEVGEEKVAPLGAHSHGRYSAKCGLPRFAAMFGRQAVPFTLFVPGYDAELYPDLIRELAGAGVEIGAHGYLHEGEDPGEREAELLERTHRILTWLAGRPPCGWRAPSGFKCARTMRKLKSLGYCYDSSDKDFDLPYLAYFDGRENEDYVCLPNNTSSLDDYPFHALSLVPPSEILMQWRQEFDAIYAEGGYFNLTLHPRAGYGSGRPARVALVEQLIEYMKGYEGVAFCSMETLARWCLAHPENFRRRWAAESGTRPV
jgi:peptidoglycan-N-acetylglucosamine deacetylase